HGVKGYFQNDLYIIRENASTKIKPNCECNTPNALLRGEQCTAKATARRLNHKTHRMLKMPRIANPS
ncbi:TPA: hypothetical protein ACJUGS_003663, partial [Vibrio cholerae]